MNRPVERRRYPRLRREERAVIRRLDDADDDPIRATLYCKTIDISASGMQVRLKNELKPGEPLDIVIHVEGYSGSFHLRGLIKWCRPVSGEDACLAGIEIVDAGNSDLVSWRRVFN